MKRGIGFLAIKLKYGQNNCYWNKRQNNWVELNNATAFKSYSATTQHIKANYLLSKLVQEGRLSVVELKVAEIKERQRPSWTDYFLGLAMTIKERSHDTQTQVGCVITDTQHRILGTGYNGFPKGMRDAELPTTRPAKYPWMRHAERNALDNCIIRPEDGIAYLTVIPCFRCLTDLWQAGITSVYYIQSGTAKCIDEADIKLREEFLSHVCNIRLIPVNPNLDWLANVWHGVKS
jgi:dCMP deaminase